MNILGRSGVSCQKKTRRIYLPIEIYSVIPAFPLIGIAIGGLFKVKIDLASATAAVFFTIPAVLD